MVHVRHRERERMESIEDPQVVSQIVNDISKINTNIKYDQICIKWYTIFVASHLDSWLTLSILSASRVFHRMVPLFPRHHWLIPIACWSLVVLMAAVIWTPQSFWMCSLASPRICLPYREPKRRDGLYTKCKELLDLRFDSHESRVMNV